MNELQLQERLSLVKNPTWNRDSFVEWYGCDPWSNNFLLGGQFRTWAARALKDPEVIDSRNVNRFAFEQYLRSQLWTPAQFAANQFALSLEHFERVLQAMIDDSLIVPNPDELPGIYSDDFLGKLPKQLPSFRTMIYGSVTSYVEEFHRAIKDDLGIEVLMRSCLVSEALKIESTAGTARDILTLEHIGLQYTVWLDFGKPISLRPDECSELTFTKYKNILSTFRMGKQDEDTQAKLQSFVAELRD